MPSSVIDDAVIVPQRYVGRTFEQYDPRTPSQARALLEAKRLAGGEIRSLVLVGPPGVGKSHLAASAIQSCRHRLHEQAAVRYRALALDEDMTPWDRVAEQNKISTPTFSWINVAEAISGLRLDMDRPFDDRHWAAELGGAQRASVTVLDDLGREKISDWTGELVYVLLNSRYESGLPTIATSNLSADELRASGYWPSISRLAEDGALVDVAGPDYRLRRAS